MACESGGVLLRALNELGWGEAGGVDALAQRALNEACAFVRAVDSRRERHGLFSRQIRRVELENVGEGARPADGGRAPFAQWRPSRAGFAHGAGRGKV